MTHRDDERLRQLPTRAARVRVLAHVAEFLVLALLLVIDFELGARLWTIDATGEFVVGALVTAFVAIVVAVLTLARRNLPVHLVVAAALSVSLMASVVAAFAGSPFPSLTEAAALVVVTAFGIRASSPRGAVAVGAASLVALVAIVLLRERDDLTLTLIAVLVWVGAVAGGLAGRFLVRRRESAIDAARRAERMELARELHDVVAHQVTGIVVQAQAAIAVARTDPARATEALTAIEAAGAEAMSGMRRMVGAMRAEEESAPPVAVPYGLGDIPALVERFDPGLARTTLRLEDPEVPLPPGVAESAYRIVRESLTNVQRHAPGAAARVSVRTEDARLLIDVVNDGVRSGGSGRGRSGFGLTGMAERVSALGGTWDAGPRESDTWGVSVSLPLGVRA